MFFPLFCESSIEPIGVTLLLGERIYDLGMEKDGEKLVGRGKEGCETARWASRSVQGADLVLGLLLTP